MEHNGGEGTQRFKKGGSQTGSRGECLKKGDLESPYELWQKTTKTHQTAAYMRWLYNIIIPVML